MTRTAIHFSDMRLAGCEAVTSSGLARLVISSNVGQSKRDGTVDRRLRLTRISKDRQLKLSTLHCARSHAVKFQRLAGTPTFMQRVGFRVKS